MLVRKVLIDGVGLVSKRNGNPRKVEKGAACTAASVIHTCQSPPLIDPRTPSHGPQLHC